MAWQVFRDAQLDVLKSMRCNCLPVLGSVLSLALCLLFGAASALVFMGVLSSTPPWSSESRATLLLELQMSDAEQESLASELRKWPEVESVVLVSRETALQQLRKELGELARVLDGFRESPLPPSVELQLKAKESSSSRLESLLEKLRTLPQVTEVLSGRAWVERLEPFHSSMKIIASFLFAFLVLTSVLLTSLYTSSSIAGRSEELEVMTLLGAPRTHVQLPFYLEVFYTGILGSLLAMGGLACLLWELRTVFPSIGPLTPAWNAPLIGLFVVALSVSGIALNWLGCWLSFKRFGQVLK